MADVRALLKAKREEGRITHPYATYSHSGQLKCTVCGVAVKHASAWEGHLGSKVHRTNIIRLREQEKQQQNEAELARKRKAVEEPTDNPDEKKRRVQTSSQGFPDDFFSDPSHAPAPLPESDEEEEEEGADGPVAITKPTNIDLEYEQFQREIAEITVGSYASDTYDRATIAADPVPPSEEIAGFPPTMDESTSVEPVQLTEEEAAKKREEEERELIMDKLLAEERAQEDADTRMQNLKSKVEGLRRKREAAKANKHKSA